MYNSLQEKNGRKRRGRKKRKEKRGSEGARNEE